MGNALRSGSHLTCTVMVRLAVVPCNRNRLYPAPSSWNNLNQIPIVQPDIAVASNSSYVVLILFGSSGVDSFMMNVAITSLSKHTLRLVVSKFKLIEGSNR